MKTAGDFDIAMIAGDITHFGPDAKVKELMKMFDKKTAVSVAVAQKRSKQKCNDIK